MRATHDRTILSARAARRASKPNTGAVGTNPGARSSTIVHATGPVRRTTCAPLTAMQRDSTGKRSAWNDSPNYFTDPKWSQTVGFQYVGGKR